jgi:hypothetical protein
MSNTLFDLVGRYFWLICLAISGYQYYMLDRGAEPEMQAQRPDRDAEATRYKRLFIGASTLPWLVMGVGQLTGSTSSVWEYFRPQDMNPFVLAFVGSVFLLSTGLLYWVFSMEGSRKAVELQLMQAHGLFGSKPLTERQVKLFAAVGPIFVILWIVMCIYMDAPPPK